MVNAEPCALLVPSTSRRGVRAPAQRLTMITELTPLPPDVAGDVGEAGDVGVGGRGSGRPKGAPIAADAVARPIARARRLGMIVERQAAA